AVGLCCGSACLAGAHAAPNHPLDPLDAEELLVIRDVLATSGRFSPDTKFAWIELEEPAKALVAGFEPGRAFARRARLAALEDRSGRLVRVLFISDQDAIDNFGPILDSVMAVVDLHGGRVVELYDVAGVPNRKVPHDVFDAKVRGAGTAKPLLPIQAQGAN